MSSQLRLSSQMVLGELATRWAHKAPHKIAFISGGKQYTYAQFNARVNKLANALLKLGIDRGDKVSLLMMNCVEIMEGYFAAAKIGAVAVPINFRLAPGEFSYQLNQSDSKALIYTSAFDKLVDAIRGNAPGVKDYIRIGDETTPGSHHYEDILSRMSDAEPGVYVDDDDPLYIMYTSGTTGRPKGIVITHKSVLMERINSTYEFGFTSNDRALVVPPLFHTGAVAVTMQMFYVGGTNVILERFDFTRIMPLVQEHEITVLLLMPVMWKMVMDLPDFDQYDSSSLKYAVSGASSMPIEMKEQIMTKFPESGCYETFGLTESTTIACMLKNEDARRKVGSIGRPVINVSARVIDLEGEDVPPGRPGELILRGPTMMKEVYKNPEATQEAVRNGWLYTGDVVRMDDEGYLYVVDRIKDMIITGGENVYPAEVETVLCSNPKIQEAAVIGVPDPAWGENVTAVVVLNPGETMTSEEVIAFCKDNIASYKKPKRVEFMDALPRNTSGKVLKKDLREIYR